MSFWNNPENNWLKVLLLVVVAVGAGYFAFNHTNRGNKGLVLNMAANQTAVTTLLGRPVTAPSGLSIALNTAYPNQTVSPDTTHYKVGSYLITNLSATETVHLTNFNIGFTGLSSTSTSEVSQISAAINGTSAGSTVATLPSNSVTNISVSSVLAPSATATVDVYATVGTVASITTFRSNLLVSGTGSSLGTNYLTYSGMSFSGQAVYVSTVPTTVACANPSVTVTSPHGGESYALTDIIHATWTSCGQPSTGTTSTEIALEDQTTGVNTYVGPAFLPFNTGHYDFHIPSGTPVGAYELRVFCVADPVSLIPCIDANHSEDLSDGTFIIGSPTTIPNLTVAKNTAYPNQTIAPGTIHAKVGSFVITNSSSASFTLSDLKPEFNSTASTIPFSDYSNLQVYLNGTQVGSTLPTISAVNDVPVPLGLIIIYPGTTKTVDIYATLGSSVFTFYPTLKITAMNGTYGVSVTYGPVVGQTISVAGAPACAINLFHSSSPTVAYGSMATVSWTTSNCTSVSISGGPLSGASTSLPANGSDSAIGPINTQLTYTLTAYGATPAVAATTTIGVTPGTDGDLYLSKNALYPNQTVAPHTAHEKIASYLVQNESSTESINLNAIHIYSTIGASDLSNLSVYVNGVQVGSSFAVPTADNVVHPTTVLASTSIATIDVYADIGSSTSGTVQTSALVSGVGSISGVSYPRSGGSPISGQVITL